MGRLKSVAVNTAAPHCSPNEEDQMPCCKDISQRLELEEITLTSFDFDAAPILYPFAIVNCFLLADDKKRSEGEEWYVQCYTPPLPDRDIRVLIRSFLI